MVKKIDYTGCSESELESLCSEKPFSRETFRPIFPMSEIYSMGKNYRLFSGFPHYLPLCVYSDHGIGSEDWLETEDPSIKSIPKRVKAIFAFSAEKVERFKKHVDIPCYLVTSPTVMYRQIHKIEPSKDAQGTIAFPVHSTPNSEVVFDVDKFCHDLQSLPEKMHPVAVCLYMTDIKKGVHRQFMQKGIPVYTAGHVYDARFTERFYDILRQFRYSVSNQVGSFAYYSCEMGIPFSLISVDSYQIINTSNPYYTTGKLDVGRVFCMSHMDVFLPLSFAVTDQQRDFVSKRLGLGQGLSPSCMRGVLYKAFFCWVFTAKGLVRFIGNFIVFVCRKRF